ncbi:MAG: acyl-CoA/acyl-ACP dehydrogenase [Proteobacteria bacterium]|nr:acyl-CoA/acyl-ACP dehydrogenase [Pseudomonadota bacterium]
MNFEPSEEQRILLKSARDFLKKECPKSLVRELAQTDDGHSPGLWRKMAGLGWAGLMLPEAYGGSGWSFLDLILLVEEMGYHACPGPFFSSAILGASIILDAADEDRKRVLLPLLASGEKIFTLALSEPGGGFNAPPRSVTAVRDGGEYVIDGVKLFVPDAQAADWLVCVARTGADPGAEEGVTLFLVESDRTGVTRTPLKTISWDQQSEVAFDRVRVPEAHAVGPIDRGWPVVRGVLDRAAVARGAEMIGCMQAAYDMALDYCKERTQFGRPIGAYQAVQHHLANMWLDTFSSRNLVYQAAWKMSEGLPAEADAAMVKTRTGELARKTTKTAHQLFGAIGFTMEHDLHIYYRRVLSADMAFGNSDHHRERVAQALGL